MKMARANVGVGVMPGVTPGGLLGLLLWIFTLHGVGLYLFTRGFLLTRVELSAFSQCSDVQKMLNVSEGKMDGECGVHGQGSGEGLPPGFREADSRAASSADRASSQGAGPGQPHEQAGADACSGECWAPRAFKRAVVVIIDALRFDFVSNSTAFPSGPGPWMGHMPAVERLAREAGRAAALFRFVADPPTTSIQRLKGLTTGGLPTFVDVGSSFRAASIAEDNLILQLVRRGGVLEFLGDDTWMDAYPTHFARAKPFPSLVVKDIDTVDDGVLGEIFGAIERADWTLLVAHFLGVDHAGHTFEVNSPTMIAKLQQMNCMLEDVVAALRAEAVPGGKHEDTLLIVMGDHAQTLSGDHGGGTPEETDTVLFALSLKEPPGKIPAGLRSPPCSRQPEDVTPGEPSGLCIPVLPQVDFAPTMAMLLGVPIPYGSVGKVSAEMWALAPATWRTPAGSRTQPSGKGEEAGGRRDVMWMQQYASVLRANSWQVQRYLEEYSSAAHTPFPALPFARLRSLYAAAQRLASDVLPPPVSSCPGGAASKGPLPPVTGGNVCARNESNHWEHVPTGSEGLRSTCEVLEEGERKDGGSQLVAEEEEGTRAIIEAYSAHLAAAAELARSQWTQFGLGSMTAGLLVLVLGLAAQMISLLCVIRLGKAQALGFSGMEGGLGRGLGTGSGSGLATSGLRSKVTDEPAGADFRFDDIADVTSDAVFVLFPAKALMKAALFAGMACAGALLLAPGILEATPYRAWAPELASLSDVVALTAVAVSSALAFLKHHLQWSWRRERARERGSAPAKSARGGFLGPQKRKGGAGPSLEVGERGMFNKSTNTSVRAGTTGGGGASAPASSVAALFSSSCDTRAWAAAALVAMHACSLTSNSFIMAEGHVACFVLASVGTLYLRRAIATRFNAPTALLLLALNAALAWAGMGTTFKLYGVATSAAAVPKSSSSSAAAAASPPPPGSASSSSGPSPDSANLDTLPMLANIALTCGPTIALIALLRWRFPYSPTCPGSSRGTLWVPGVGVPMVLVIISATWTLQDWAAAQFASSKNIAEIFEMLEASKLYLPRYTYLVTAAYTLTVVVTGGKGAPARKVASVGGHRLGQGQASLSVTGGRAQAKADQSATRVNAEELAQEAIAALVTSVLPTLIVLVGRKGPLVALLAALEGYCLITLQGGPPPFSAPSPSPCPSSTSISTYSVSSASPTAPPSRASARRRERRPANEAAAQPGGATGHETSREWAHAAPALAPTHGDDRWEGEGGRRASTAAAAAAPAGAATAGAGAGVASGTGSAPAGAANAGVDAAALASAGAGAGHKGSFWEGCHGGAAAEWAFVSLQLFFCTGHRCTFDGLHYPAAFTGFEDFNYFRQGALLALETFGASHVLPTVALPLLALAPFGGRSGLPRQLTPDDRRALFLTQLAKVCLVYGLVRSLSAAVTTAFVTLERRHLMVWALFAPKYVFDAVGLLLIDFFLILSALFALYAYSAASRTAANNMLGKKL